MIQFGILDCGFINISEDLSEFPILVKSEFRIPKSEIKVAPLLRFLTADVVALVYFGHH